MIKKVNRSWLTESNRNDKIVDKGYIIGLNEDERNNYDDYDIFHNRQFHFISIGEDGNYNLVDDVSLATIFDSKEAAWDYCDEIADDIYDEHSRMNSITFELYGMEKIIKVNFVADYLLK